MVIFAGNTNTVTITTTTDGIATAPTLTANSIVGSYTVTATVAGAIIPVLFNLNNVALAPVQLVITNFSPNVGNSLSASLIISNPSSSSVSLSSVLVTDTYIISNTVVNSYNFSIPQGYIVIGPGGQTTIQNGSNGNTVAVVGPQGTHQICTQAFNYGSSYGNSIACATIVVGGASAFTSIAGSGQSTSVNASFVSALQAKVTNSAGNGVSGVSVTFTAPATGASGTFIGGSNTITITTDVNGVAIAPAFTANGSRGTFNVTASINTPGITSLTAISFTLTNQ